MNATVTAAWLLCAATAPGCKKADPVRVVPKASDTALVDGPGPAAAPDLAAAAHDPLPPIPEPVPAPGAPRLDVAFCIDATGSMKGVIGRARAKIEEIAAWVQRGKPTPAVRYGLVVYRDRNDDEPVRSYGFLPSARAMRDALGGVVATGGGDLPEDVIAGLRVAVGELSWDPAARVKMLFLVGDAEPHLDYPDGDDAALLAAAREKGIRIGAIAGGGMSKAGHKYWKRVATATGGPYLALPGTAGTPALAETELEDVVYEALRAEASRAGIAYAAAAAGPPSSLPGLAGPPR